MRAHPIQTAFVVEDIHAAIQDLTSVLKAGPWFLREHGVFPEQRYRGQKVATELSIALAYSGGMQFELIQQHDDGPSVYREVVEARGYGLHHFGVGAEDYAAGCAAQTAGGLTLVYEATVANGARVGYFETPQLPFMIEIIEMKPKTRAMFASILAAHESWDGSVEIRPLAPVRA